ncbi:hypothetical protein BGZ60DRAFT_418927 [Tricladium varicosporioides]|nr:hypothetical protein BGZ60DRAFT_418927 [Hymenoscyphus varicosporioides]
MNNDIQSRIPWISMLDVAPPNPDDLDWIMDEKIWRGLRWPLFGPISNIKVMEDAGDSLSALQPLLGHPNSHPLASQIATDPPRSRMLMISWMVGMYEADTEDPIPEPLAVEKPDGLPITVGDIVMALHPYLTQMEGVIREVYNSKEKFYFAGFGGMPKTAAPNIDLLFLVNLKEDEGDMEDHWQNQARIVRAQREHWPPKVDKPHLLSPFYQLLGGQASAGKETTN